MLNKLCGPSVIYLGFSTTHIIIDIFKKMFNTALLKFFIMIFFTLILNILCEMGLSIISWIIVFIPFIFITLITSILLITFNLHPKSGKHDYKKKDKDNKKDKVIQIK